MSISVKGITKVFPNKNDKKISKTVLKDISFDVGEGEFVFFLDRQAAGRQQH
jgi:ABC-type multidrug transport system ATPase subunit